LSSDSRKRKEIKEFSFEKEERNTVTSLSPPTQIGGGIRGTYSFRILNI